MLSLTIIGLDGQWPESVRIFEAVGSEITHNYANGRPNTLHTGDYDLSKWRKRGCLHQCSRP
jgi:hypothetical protein